MGDIIGVLVGRRSKLTITNAEGTAIIKQGEIITPQVIDAVRDQGKLNDLMLAEAMAEDMEIEPMSKYVEIGEENPRGVHPEHR